MQKVKSLLLEPFTLGRYLLKNRVVMSAMTRNRADPKDGIPNQLHATYYSERAENAGFVLTECSGVSAIGNCLPGAAGIYTEEQAKGWEKVCEEVHKQNGIIFLQIWHGGRSGRKSLIGEDPVGPSPIPQRMKKNGTIVTNDIPRELSETEIAEIVEDFRKSAKLALEAGIDGLELHGANGYLVDQFLRSSSNQRTDKYGGSIENRCRFALEVIDALISVYGADRVGIKLSPVNRYGDMFDSDPLSLYQHLLTELNKRNIAFVELVQSNEEESLYDISPVEQIPDVFKAFRPYFKNVIIGNFNLNLEKGTELVNEGICDMVSFGRMYISNPDLVHRLKNGWELAQPDYTLLYSGGAKGYIDYPKYQA